MKINVRLFGFGLNIVMVVANAPVTFVCTQQPKDTLEVNQLQTQASD